MAGAGHGETGQRICSATARWRHCVDAWDSDGWPVRPARGLPGLLPRPVPTRPGGLPPSPTIRTAWRRWTATLSTSLESMTVAPRRQSWTGSACCWRPTWTTIAAMQRGEV